MPPQGKRSDESAFVALARSARNVRSMWAASARDATAAARRIVFLSDTYIPFVR